MVSRRLLGQSNLSWAVVEDLLAVGDSVLTRAALNLTEDLRLDRLDEKAQHWILWMVIRWLEGSDERWWT